MSLLDDLLFETERRSILFHKDTSMPDGTQLGFNGNPNNANPTNSNGEFLLNHCPSGTRYIQKNVIPFQLWEKLSDASGGEWFAAGTSAPTTSDNSFTIPTGVMPIGGDRCIATLNGVAAYASCDDLDLTTVGISMNAATNNSVVKLSTSGKLIIPGATFNAGEAVFVGLNGVFVTSPIIGQFTQQVGIAHASDILLVQINQPIFTGE